jgi:hypothetical protein
MLKNFINFITKSKAVLVFCLILAIGLNLFYFNIFTNARPLSVIKQNSGELTFGVSVEKESIPNNINLVSGPWVLSKWDQHNTDWLNQFKQPNNINKTPYLYLYIAAGKARSDWDLEDCNTGAEKTKTLCYRGAEYLRNNRQYVNQAYIDTANNIKKIYGTNKEIALHIEPDFYQYTNSDQLNGGLTFDEAAKDLNEWTDSIKKILPNSHLVMDVSPWNSDLKGWSNIMRNFDYAGIVGKRLSPNGDGTTPAGVDGRSYAKISQDTGKQLILDDSHGVGGYWLPFDYDWSNKELTSQRFKDGIAAVILPPNDLNFLNSMVAPNTPKLNTDFESTSSSSLSKSSSSPSNTNSSPSSQANNINVIVIESPVVKTSSSQVSNSSIASSEYNLNNRIILQSPGTYTKVKTPNSAISSSSKAKPTVSFSQIVCSANSIDISLAKTSNWKNGFVTTIKVKNNSSQDLQSWSINQTPLPSQQVTNMWNIVRTDNTFTANSEWNSKIKPGQEVEVGGFTTSFSENDNMADYNCSTIF